MSKKITINNIKNFIEGNTNQVLSSMGLKPESFMEQVRYRKSVCLECLNAGACLRCGCSLPGRFYTEESCNKGELFPDIMNDEDWLKFKQENHEDFKKRGLL